MAFNISGLGNLNNIPAVKKQTSIAITAKQTPAQRAKYDAAIAKARASAVKAAPARKGSSTSSTFSTMLKKQAAAAPVKKSVDTGQSAVGGAYDGNAYVSGAQDQFGYNPSVAYNPVDTSQIVNLLGKWDPNSISQIYDPAYQNLDRLRTQGKADYATGDTKLADIYRTLTNQISQSADQVGLGYQNANNNIKADATMLSGAAAADAQAITGRREQMLKNLGIESAAPDLTANDGAAMETGRRVTQAASVQANLASLLGANATAYTQNQANNANMQGAEARSGLLSQLNSYMGDLAGKQSDIDSSRSQAVATGYQNYQDAQRSLGLQKMQFDMQNSQNAYNAANQNNQNAMSMFNSWNDQQAKQYATDSEAQSAYLKQQADAQQASQAQANWQAEFGLKQQTANAKAGGSGDLYTTMRSAATNYGLPDKQFNAAMDLLNSTAASGAGLGSNPGQFATRVSAANSAGINPNVLSALAAAYWQTSGAKASNNLYG